MYNFRSLTLSSVSTTEPVSVAEVKTSLRIQTSAEDTLLGTMITVARKQCENMIKRSLIPSSWLLVLDSFSSDDVTLPRPPLSTDTSKLLVTYIDTTGGTSTVSSTVYDVDSNMEPGQIRLGYNQSWPSDIRGHEGVISVAYASGYTTATIPEEIKQWICQRVGTFFEHRESMLLDGRKLVNIPYQFVDGLLDEYRIMEMP